MNIKVEMLTRKANNLLESLTKNMTKLQSNLTPELIPQESIISTLKTEIIIKTRDAPPRTFYPHYAKFHKV